MDPAKRRVSLVPGSGGARGLAHIGVIEWLCAQGCVIESIAGTSMGALIGGIYATGKLDVYADWVRALERRDVIRLLDFSWQRAGLFKGERVVSALKSLIGEHDIGDLPISFTAVATDLESGKEVWLSKGPLFDAIRASIAIPTIFTPYEINGRTLVDGGLVNPVPIAPTLHDMTDLTIAVTLSGPPSNPAPAASAKDTDTQRAEIAYQRLIRDFVDSLQQREPERGRRLGVARCRHALVRDNAGDRIASQARRACARRGDQHSGQRLPVFRVQPCGRYDRTRPPPGRQRSRKARVRHRTAIEHLG